MPSSSFFRSRRSPTAELTPQEQVITQEQQAVNQANQEAEYQDLVKKDQREQQQKQAAIESEQKKAAAAQKAKVAAMKRAGVATEMDASGNETVKTHDDGSPLYKADFLGKPAMDDTGKASATYRDTRNQRFNIPLDAINRTTDAAGQSFYEFDVNGQRIRRPESPTNPLFKVDPATGRRYSEAQDAETGSFVQQPLGIDPRAASKAAITRKQAEFEKQKQQHLFDSQNLDMERTSAATNFEPVRERFTAAKSAAKKFTTGKRYEQGSDGLYSIDRINGEDSRNPINSNDTAEIAKANAWLASKKTADDELAAARAEHDPAKQRLHDLEVKRNTLAEQALRASQAHQTEVADMEEASKAGLSITQPGWKTVLDEMRKNPRYQQIVAAGEYADHGSDLSAAINSAITSINRRAPNYVEAKQEPPLSVAQKVLRDLSAKMPRENYVDPSAPPDAKEIDKRNFVQTIADGITTGKPQADAHDIKTAQAIAAKSLNVADPENWSLTPGSMGDFDLHHADSEEPVGRLDPDNNRILLFPNATLGEAGKAMMSKASPDGMPVYRMGGAQPMTPQELRDYVAGAVESSRMARTETEKETALAQAGVTPDDIRDKMMSGRISVQDAKWLNQKLFGASEHDNSREGYLRGFQDWLGQNPTAKDMLAKGTPAQKGAVIDQYATARAGQSQSDTTLDRDQLTERRFELQQQFNPQSTLTKAGNVVKEALVPMAGMLTQAAAYVPMKVAQKLGAEADAIRLSDMQGADWWNNFGSFVRKMNARPDVESNVDELRQWAVRARPGEQPPQELADKLAKAVYEGYHAYTPEQAKDRDTSEDSFNVNKDPQLKAALQSYLATSDAGALQKLMQLMVTDRKARNTQAELAQYIERPRVATAAEVLDRAAPLGIKLNEGSAGALLSLSKSLETAKDAKQQEAILAQAGKIIGTKTSDDTALAFHALTTQATTDPNSITGMFRSGFSAGPQEMGTEVASSALEAMIAMGTGLTATPEIIAERAARTGARAALRRTFSRVATRTLDAITEDSAFLTAARRGVASGRAKLGGALAKAEEDFAKAGIVTPKFGQPLTFSQKARNVAVQAGKTGIAAVPTESAEEGFGYLGENDPTLPGLATQTAMGGLGGFLVGPSFLPIAYGRNVLQTRKANAVVEAQKAKWAENFNAQMASVPGFKPMTPADFDSWAGLQNNPTHQAAVAEYADALTELENATEINTAAAAGAVPTTGNPGANVIAAKARLDAAKQNLVGLSESAFMAADELRQIPEADRPLYTGIAKAVSGAREFTEAEATALVKLEGNNKVAFQQSETLPADVAGPRNLKTLADLPDVTPTAPKRYALPDGVQVAVPDAAVAMLAEKAPQTAALLGHHAAAAPVAQTAPQQATNAPATTTTAPATNATASTTPRQPTTTKLGLTIDDTPAKQDEVESIVRATLDTELARNKKVRGIVTVAPYQANDGGMLASTTSGKVHVDVNRLAAATWQEGVNAGGMTRKQVADHVLATLDHEVRHIAHLQAAQKLFGKTKAKDVENTIRKRRETHGAGFAADQARIEEHRKAMEAAGASAEEIATRIRYEHWLSAHYGNIWNHDLTEAQRQAVRDAYGPTLDSQPDWQKGMEAIRMISQMGSKFGRISEAIIRHLKEVLDVLKSLFTSPPESIAKDIAAIEKILGEYGYGTKKPAKSKEAEKPKTETKVEAAPLKSEAATEEPPKSVTVPVEEAASILAKPTLTDDQHYLFDSKAGDIAATPDGGNIYIVGHFDRLKDAKEVVAQFDSVRPGMTKIIPWLAKPEKEGGKQLSKWAVTIANVSQEFHDQLNRLREENGIGKTAEQRADAKAAAESPKSTPDAREQWQKTYAKFKRALARAVKAKDYAEIIRQAEAFQKHYETEGNEPFPDSWSDWERHKADAELQLSRQGETPLNPLVVPTLKTNADNPRPSARTDAAYLKAQQDARDALAGLFSAPAPTRHIPQLDVPRERFDAVRKMAESVLAAEIRQPEAFAQFMDDTFPGGKARAYSEAIWDMIGIADKSLRGTHDWSAIYAKIDTPLPEVVEPPEEEETPPANDISTPSQASLAGSVMRTLLDGKEFDVSPERQRFNTLTAKEFDEAVELGITMAAHQIVSQSRASENGVFDLLVDLYKRQPVLGAKTSTSKINQAYSTPAPMAYIASRLADVASGKVIAEPTAGNGMLLIERQPNQTILANELDPARRERLAMQGIEATGEDGTKWTPAQAPDRVVANPPFGQVMQEGGSNAVFSTPAGDTTSIDHAIVLRSLETMTPDGRAVFIIGGPPPTVRTPEAREAYYRGSKPGKFFGHLYQNFNVIDHFTVNGELYEKQGAGWPLDIIIIDGKKPSSNTLPGLKSPRIINSWEELKNELDRTDADRIKLNQLTADEMRVRTDAVAAGLSQLGGKLPEPISNRPGNSGPAESAGNAGPTDSGGTAGNAELAQSDVRGTAQSDANAPATGTVRSGQDAGLGGRSTGGNAQGSDRERERSGVTDYQAPFAPASNVNAAGLLAPVNLIEPMTQALNRLKSQVGELVPFVRDKLGYPKNADISKYFFGDQIDALAQAIHTAENGGALVIGDQTGTGKGRIAAGLMKYALKQGLVPVFVTKNQDLYDAMLDDLMDIDAPEVVPVITNNAINEKELKKKLKKLGSYNGEDVFNEIASTGNLPEGTNVIFTTYDQIKADDAPGLSKRDRYQAKRNEEAPPSSWRMAALRRVAPNALFILDESHLAGGQSATGWRFGELLQLAKHAYYSSATFAKRPDNMGIYFRTNLGQVGGDIKSLMALMQSGGVPAMQVGSTMLAQDGQYMRRERSYDGVSFATHTNSDSYERDKELADNYTDGLRTIIHVQERMVDAAQIVNTLLQAFGQSVNIPVGNRARLESANFSAKLHNLVRQYLLGIKVNSAARLAVQAIKNGVKGSDGTVRPHKVIVAVENTMESIIEELAQQGLPLNFNGALQMYLNQMRRIKVSGGAYGSTPVYFEVSDTPDPRFADIDDERLRTRLVEMGVNPETGANAITVNQDVANEMIRRAMSGVFREAAKAIESINLADMPISPIDAMRQAVEREGIRTGEMTGRTTGIDSNGEVYERPASEVKGKLKAKDAFNNEDLDFLVINKSGSTGVSMHASEKFKDKRPRLMIVAQANLDINEFMQTLGRIHRAGQVELPAFVMLQTALPAENRPAAITGKKMSMLNANTTSNADSELTQKEAIDIFNQYGDQVVWNYLSKNPGLVRLVAQSWEKLVDNGVLKPLGDFQSADSGGEFGYLARSVTGHLAILPVDEQEAFWEAVTADYKGLIAYLDEIGKNDLRASVLDMKAKTVSREIFTAGTAGESTSVFSDPSYIEVVDAKLGREPLKADEAWQTASESRQRAEGRQDAFIKRADEFIAAEDARKAKAARNWDERRQEWLNHQQEQRDTISNALGQIGNFGTYERDDGSNGYAFVEDVLLNDEKPNTPSAQMAVIRLNDSQDRVKIPVSQFAEFFTPSSFSDYNRERGAKQGWERSWTFGTQQAVITGNLLSALAELSARDQKGRVVSYTKEDGSQQMGILLGQSMATALIRRNDSAIQVADIGQLREALGEKRRILSSDGSIALSQATDGMMVVNVPANRQTGGKYWRDPTLNRLMSRGEFEQTGNQMIGLVTPQNIEAVFDYFRNSHNALFSYTIGRDDSLASAPAMPIDRATAIVRNLDKVQAKRALNQREKADYDAAKVALASAPNPSSGRGMASDTGAAQSKEPSPGGLSEADALFERLSKEYDLEIEPEKVQDFDSDQRPIEVEFGGRKWEISIRDRTFRAEDVEDSDNGYNAQLDEELTVYDDDSWGDVPNNIADIWEKAPSNWWDVPTVDPNDRETWSALQPHYAIQTNDGESGWMDDGNVTLNLLEAVDLYTKEESEDKRLVFFTGRKTRGKDRFGDWGNISQLEVLARPSFVGKLLRDFPGMTRDEAVDIARTRNDDNTDTWLVAQAYARHRLTNYDDRLRAAREMDEDTDRERSKARFELRSQIDEVMNRWSNPPKYDEAAKVSQGGFQKQESSEASASGRGMASDTGAAQNAEPSPGGLSEAGRAALVALDEVSQTWPKEPLDWDVDQDAWITFKQEQMPDAINAIERAFKPRFRDIEAKWAWDIAKTGSQYIHGEIPLSYTEDDEPLDTEEFKISVRDHGVSPFRERELGFNTKVIEIDSFTDPSQVKRAFAKVINELDRLYRLSPKANAEPLTESGAAGIKPKVEGGEESPHSQRNVRQGTPPQTPPSVKPDFDTPGAEDRALMSAPPDARREALASMPPIWREVLEAVTKGESVPQIAKRKQLPEAAVGNILRVAQGRLNVLLKAAEGSLKPTVRVENNTIKASSGRPELAMSAIPNFNAVDANRASSDVVTHTEMNEMAAQMLEAFPDAAERLVVRWMDSGTTVLNTDGFPDGLRAMVRAAEGRQAAQMLMTAAAKLLVSQKALESGNSLQIARLVDAYRNTGTETARALGMRYDPHLTPEERAAMFISEVLLTPPDAIRRDMKKNPQNKAALLAKWAQRADAIKQALKADGYDIEATFKSFHEEQQAARETIPADMRLPLAQADRQTKTLVKAIMEGLTPAQAAQKAGIVLDKARQLYVAFRNRVNKAGAEAAAKMRDAMLRSAPPLDFASAIGMPDADIFDQPNVSPLNTPATQKLKRIRQRPKPQGTINLADPVSVARATNAAGPHKSTAFDAMSEFWRASILSGPQTHVVNFVSSALYGTYEATAKKLGTAAMADMARVFGMKPDAASLADLPAMMSAALPALQNAWRDGMRSLKTETRAFEAYARGPEAAASFKGDAYTPALGGLLGKVMRSISFRAMTAADEFVKSFFTRLEVAAQARQIARTEGKTGQEMADRIAQLLQPGSDAWLRALDHAHHVTFQTELQQHNRAIDQIDGFAQLITRAKKGDFGFLPQGVSHFVFPFVATPANIFKAGITMSPLGGLLSIIDAARAYDQRRKGNVDEANRIYNAARALDDLANQIVAWGALYALSSLVKPGDGDDDLPFLTGSMEWRATSKGERELAYRTAPPLSVRIGGQWYSYKRLDPFASALAFVVDSIKAFEKGQPMEEAWAAVGVRVLANMQDKTFLQGISDLMNAIHDPGRYGSRWATNIATGFVPNLIRQPIRSADPYIRESDLPNDMGFFDALAHRVGYGIVPQGAMPKVDVWGRPARKDTGTGGPLTDSLLRLFSPVDTKDAGNADPLDVALLRYNLTHDDNQFAMTAPRREIQRTRNGTTVRFSLNDDEYNELAALSGQAARRALGGAYDRELNESDVKKIKSVIESYHELFVERAYRRKLGEMQSK